MGANESVDGPAVRFDHLVVGIDRSPESLYALDLAATIGAPLRAALTIVHVHPRPVTLSISPAATTEYERAELEVDVGVAVDAESRLSSYPGAWSVISRRGQVAHELLDVAERVDADAIVVGHRSHGPLRDAVLGSVAAGTVHRSHRSVIIAIGPRTE